jgi:hypothetical protein
MKSITLAQFQQLLQRHLKGITFFEDIVLKIPFETNSKGMVDSCVIDNMRLIFILTLGGLAKEAPKSASFQKMTCVLEELLPYGTFMISDRTKQFLWELKKNPQLIAKEVTYDIPKEVYVNDDPLPEDVAKSIISYLTYLINDSQLNVVDESTLN